jgi:uncharacterized protein
VLRAILDACEVAVTPLSLVADEIAAQRGSLDQYAHRPWPLPERRWLMGQTWRHLLFAHWSVDRAALARIVPAPLELDLYESRAWLGVTPFVITGLRTRGTPPLPRLSRFPELNVRTYVRFGEKPGIYFFSLDAAERLAVAAARHGYRLPYFRAEMRVDRSNDEIRYESRRADPSGPAAELRVAYRPTGQVTDDSLARWLAERYCVYVVDERGRALRGDIHHRPWPLRPAAAEIELNTMARPLGIELDRRPLLHYSVRQDTLIWPLQPA